MPEAEYDVGDKVRPEFRFFGPNGALADPTSVTVAVLRGDGALMAPVPRKDAVGVYSVDLIFDVPGAWVARGVGTGGDADGATDHVYFVKVPATEGPPATFGASVGDVLALTPEREITDETPTTLADVRGFVAHIGHQVTAELAGRLATLEELGGADAVYPFRVAARGVVTLGAAALTQDSGYPERAGVASADQSYGAVLWTRYRSSLADLAGAIDADIKRRRPARASDDPGISSPEPFSRLGMRF